MRRRVGWGVSSGGRARERARRGESRVFLANNGYSYKQEKGVGWSNTGREGRDGIMENPGHYQGRKSYCEVAKEAINIKTGVEEGPKRRSEVVLADWNADEATSKRLKKCLVGYVEALESLEEIKSWCSSVVDEDCSMKYLGGRNVLVLFEQKKTLVNVINNRSHELHLWITGLRRWTEKAEPDEDKFSSPEDEDTSIPLEWSEAEVGDGEECVEESVFETNEVIGRNYGWIQGGRNGSREAVRIPSAPSAIGEGGKRPFMGKFEFCNISKEKLSHNNDGGALEGGGKLFL
ncbi:hypothetical protein L6452_42237 [Arctium lappa]|uniref:Uncharacterized protein n=1 Tax=Arctium lappa TaxID=4217 RepID=A0ACB8XIF8_ARCLA|nr:hypothetical protein L6452_42237 [Arctium lappa]